MQQYAIINTRLFNILEKSENRTWRLCVDIIVNTKTPKFSDTKMSWILSLISYSVTKDKIILPHVNDENTNNANKTILRNISEQEKKLVVL